MSLNYIIEVRPRPYGKTVPAGLVVRDGNQFRFFSATHDFDRLEGQLFKNPKEAETAALRQFNDKRLSGSVSPPDHSSSNKGVER